MKARAEALGFECNTGFAERGERLLIVLVAAFVTGLGVSWLLAVALWFLVAATTITVGQRVRCVYRQASAAGPKPQRPARRPLRPLRPRSRRIRQRRHEQTPVS